MSAWRPIAPQDRTAYLAMVDAFYHSDVVIKPIPKANMEATFNELLRSNTYAEGYVCEYEGQIVGYALLAKTFSQEAGGMVVWIEELHIEPPFRGKGLGSGFFTFLFNTLGDNVKRVRLEVERDNTRAVKLYQSFGFDFFEYDQMVLER